MTTVLRREKIIYVRATEPEKDAIYARASAANLSASQFLIRVATDGRPPPSREERARLEHLLFVFRRAALHLRQLAANTRALRLAGASTDTEQELQEAAGLLQELTRHLRGRL